MKNIKSFLRRPVLLALALALAAAPGVSELLGVRAFADTEQVQTRSIQMSDSTLAATGVSYLVTFTPAQAGAQSLVLDFCSNSSIIGGACTQTAGLVPDFTSASFTGGTQTGSWTLGSASGATVKLTGSGHALAATPVTFTLTGVDNPSTSPAGSFFARIYTYTDAAYGGGSAYTSPTAIGNNLDYGGFALSTTSSINITAIVMETLTFCVSDDTPIGDGCTGTEAPDLTLGHGSPKVLDSTQVDTAVANTQISTNATNGAVVAMKDLSSTNCGGLSRNSGTSCGIPAIGAYGAIPGSTADFGLHVDDGTGTIGSSVADPAYGTTADEYGLNESAVNGVLSTYGDTIFDTNDTVCANVNTPLTFGAQASTTTPAGVYTVNESLIATGTF